MPAHHDQQPRSGRAEPDLRQKMLDAAQDMLEEVGGLTVSLEHLRLEEVIARAGVARSSVYRTWPNRDDFYVDLLCELAGPSWQGTAAFDQKTINLASSIVAERLHLLPTAEGRRQVMRETVRRGAEQNFKAVVASAQWRTYVAITATLLAWPEDNQVRQRVQRSLGAAESKFINMMATFYEDMSIILGFRLREPYTTYTTLAATGAAVVEGLGLRQMIAPEAVNTTFTLPGPEGPEEWTLPALGFMAILDEIVEPDPDYNFNDALAAYFKRRAVGNS